MKRIEGVFIDGEKKSKLIFCLLAVGLFLVIVSAFSIKNLLVFSFLGLLLMMVCSILVFVKTMFKTVLVLSVSGEGSVLQIDYSGKKYDLKFPFKYDVCILPVVHSQYRSMLHFKIVFYDSAGIKHSFYEKIENEISEMKGIKILSNTEKWLLGINENIKPFPSILWQIYQELEKHPECKNIGKRKASEIDSPFEE